MAKKLGFDLGRFRYFVDFYQQTVVVDEFGSQQITWNKVLGTRGDKIIKNRTFQSQLNAGELDFFQIYYFAIRDREGFSVSKDMIIHCDGVLYSIQGYAPLDYNPLYIQIFTSTINDSSHALWDVINSMPITADYNTIIENEY